MDVMSAEAAVLHALLAENDNEGISRLRQFLPGELDRFARACRKAARFADAISAEQEEARHAALTPEERLREIVERLGMRDEHA